MAFINQQSKEIHCKVVYYGPSLGGKTTNIQWVYQKTSGQDTVDIPSFEANPERTLFFDFLPMNIGNVHGLKVRFHLYTVPGQIVYDASRKLILKGLDGIIFVADSQTERMEENLESMKNLKKNLEIQGYRLEDVPLVLQYNKRDLPNASSVSELRASLNDLNAPDYEATASAGKGVMESLKTVSQSIIRHLKSSAS